MKYIKDNKMDFDTFKDSLTGNLFFVVINTDYKYKDKYAEEFISQLKRNFNIRDKRRFINRACLS